MFRSQRKTILQNLASFIDASGFYALQYQMADGFIDMAIALLDVGDADTAIQISPFLMEYVKANPGDSQAITQKIIERLSIHFQTAQHTPTDPICEALQKVVKICATANTEETYYFLDQALDIVDFGDLPTAAAILYVTTQTFSNKKLTEQRQKIIEKYISLTELDNFDSDILYYNYIMFIHFFNSSAEAYGAEAITIVYNSLKILTVTEISDEPFVSISSFDIHESITRELLYLIKTYGKLVSLLELFLSLRSSYPFFTILTSSLIKPYLLRK